ncbi:MAG TPA: hypothetical protein ENG03_09885 [Thioploca sp.]|nr:hypothetical protein [Thioploca sp.]
MSVFDLRVFGLDSDFSRNERQRERISLRLMALPQMEQNQPFSQLLPTNVLPTKSKRWAIKGHWWAQKNL